MLCAPIVADAAQCPINQTTGLPDCNITFCSPLSNNIARSACAATTAEAAGESHHKNFFRTGTGQAAIAVAAGVVFIGVMWYIFKTPQSQNFDNQVKLMAF